jgi:hypothetical protein
MIVSIPKNLPFSSLWKTNKFFVYALSRCCVGISPLEVVEWKVRALHWEEVDVVRTPKTMKFKFPEILFEFYGFIQNDLKYNLTLSGDIVLMIIEKKDSSEKIYTDSCLKTED